jgi:hypothetical protein
MQDTAAEGLNAWLRAALADQQSGDNLGAAVAIRWQLAISAKGIGT